MTKERLEEIRKEIPEMFTQDEYGEEIVKELFDHIDQLQRQRDRLMKVCTTYKKTEEIDKVACEVFTEIHRRREVDEAI